MAYVVSRPKGRWEIRESMQTRKGPRARTLASFAALDEGVIAKAAARARTPFDAVAVRRAAHRAGATFRPEPAERLCGDLARGLDIRPGLRRLLSAVAAGADDELAMWLGVSMKERSVALVDLLRLSDRLPHPSRRPLAFPGLRRADPAV